MLPKPRPASHIVQIFLVCMVLGVVVALTIWGLKYASPAPLRNAPPGAAQAPQWPSTMIEEKTITDKGPGYQITAVYPVTTSMAIGTAIKSFIDDQIAAFKNDQEGMVIPPDAATQVYTLDITYKEERNAVADNYTFTTATDTGGAHGMTTTKTFTYDQNGVPITIDALFADPHEGLAAVALIVQKDLLARENAQASFIKEGAAPTEDNYADFTVQTDGVTFIFDPYQVAPYAAGIQRVNVPLAAFAGYASALWRSR